MLAGTPVLGYILDLISFTALYVDLAAGFLLSVFLLSVFLLVGLGLLGVIFTLGAFCTGLLLDVLTVLGADCPVLGFLITLLEPASTTPPVNGFTPPVYGVNPPVWYFFTGIFLEVFFMIYK